MKNEENYHLRNIVIRPWVERRLNDEMKNLQIFRVSVKKDDVATNIIEGWNDRYNFDNLAFRNAIYDKIKINVTEVKRLVCDVD